MTQFVVDASVAIKWVLPEIHSEAALRLNKVEYELLAPDFFFPEIGNILWKRVQRTELSLDAAKTNLEVLKNLPLHIFSSSPLMSIALETAVRVNQAVYDCLYLTLAVQNQCCLVTADERFFNVIRNDALATHICWVQDLP